MLCEKPKSKKTQKHTQHDFFFMMKSKPNNNQKAPNPGKNRNEQKIEVLVARQLGIKQPHQLQNLNKYKT